MSMRRDQIQKRRGIALLHTCHRAPRIAAVINRIQRPKRPVTTADMIFYPCLRSQRRISIPIHSAECRVVGNVKNIRMILFDPWSGSIVLIADCINAQTALKHDSFLWCPVMADTPDCLCQVKRSSPQKNPERTGILFVRCFDNQTGSRRIISFAKIFHSNMSASFCCYGKQLLCSRVTVIVPCQIFPDLPIGMNQLPDILRFGSMRSI